jgi:hypothetical protein
MVNNADIGRWKFFRSPAKGEVYYLGLGDIDVNLPLFEIDRKSHKVTLQCGTNYIGHEYRSVVGESGSFRFVDLERISGEVVI